MIVISDTSVITNLIQLEQLNLLGQLFDQVIIPRKVHEELGKRPEQTELISQLDWIEVRDISNNDLYNKLLDILDAGESESIALALELNADLLIIDEKRGRKIAKDYGIPITGLLGIIVEAKEVGYINSVKPLLDQLIYDIGFRVSPKLYLKIMELVGE